MRSTVAGILVVAAIVGAYTWALSECPAVTQALFGQPRVIIALPAPCAPDAPTE